MKTKNHHAILGALTAATMSASAATTVLIDATTNNGGFEDPDVGTPTNFSTGTITNWSTWTEVSTASGDTGVYDSGAAGSQDAYIQPGGAIYNLTSYVIQVGDTFDYSFVDILGSRGDATMQLVYDDGGTITAITGTDLVGNQNVDGQTYSDSFTVQSGDAWVGKTVGVGFFTSASYPEIDNVELSVTAVPEPSGAALLGLAAVGFMLRRRR